ncbi:MULTISPECIES: AraC family transcriptional regulator [unclassified Rubrivivax]|uniref:AraC family transcriptional regulator n=1 Tax=unclassified Rubrivivax TaxID=2649762 RepID=UPI0013E91A33|nr:MULTISPECIES: AraC family transcriptional regulator [unclassified Rubrivivax]MCC9596884.1 AraC family transcriptional regulator [Rubrivivax sp. JA1055]MCC9649040.1 AraC family transcriptional regulator [Rubrivivax sp. JA1029]MCD0421199.1 AraC family transcriptional regulator [Rubrivivax sp. JA1024]
MTITPAASMPGVPQAFEAREDAAEFRRPAHRPGVELYRAAIVRHAFEPHAHDGFGVGAIEAGAERFRYRGSELLAPADSLVLMNPGELHTGRAETEAGWRYRMAYVDEALVQALTGERWCFADAVAADAPRARRVGRLLAALWQAADEPLAFDGLLAELLDVLRPHARADRAAAREAAPRFGVVLDCMQARLAERLTLEELAAVAGLSPFHFLRRFREAQGATPQQVLMSLRLQAAQRQLAAGVAPAEVAAATGLADQAHLTRAFAARYGVTPARYQRQVRAR